jgi:regulator of extracellular matrix RemA (YlzA/DUF370 family)
LTALNATVLTAIPIASATIAAAESAGLRRIWRKARRTSPIIKRGYGSLALAVPIERDYVT